MTPFITVMARRVRTEDAIGGIGRRCPVWHEYPALDDVPTDGQYDLAKVLYSGGLWKTAALTKPEWKLSNE